jgi:hypothetical protein
MRSKIFITIFIFMLFTLGATSVRGQDAAITDLVVVNNETDLLGFFKIDDAFSPELKNGVQHGIPVTFTFEILLEMIRDGWLDKEVFSGSFDHTMTYDSLKKEYTVNNLEDSENKLVTNDVKKAMDFMSEINSIKVCSLAELSPDRLYTLQVKATLAKTTLPLNFHYLIPFTEFWDLKTDWQKIEFRY